MSRNKLTAEFLEYSTVYREVEDLQNAHKDQIEQYNEIVDELIYIDLGVQPDCLEEYNSVLECENALESSLLDLALEIGETLAAYQYIRREIDK